MRGAEAGGLVLACIVAAMLSLAARPRAAQNREDLQQLNIWLTAIARHAPGERDAAEESVARWSRRDLDAAFSTLKKVGVPADLAPTVETHLDIDGVPGPHESGTPQEFDAILRRAALLHTDIAILHHVGAGYDLPPDGAGGVINGDAELVGTYAGTVHWAFARSLLDAIKPRPADDAFVLQWYRATAECLQSWSDDAALGRHFQRAFSLFPNDPVLLFDAGTEHESYASPAMQAFRAATTLRVPFGPESRELAVATALFQQVLKENPSLVEARIRLAHVIGMGGLHKEAVAELRRALSSPLPPLLEFYAQVLLGRELLTMGRNDEARGAAARALTLFPGAQSARLLLSEAEQDAGAERTAIGELAILAQPTASADRDDPWWQYAGGHVPSAQTLILQLWRGN